MCSNQASPSPLLEEEEDMMLGFAKPWQKQQERRTEDFSAIRRLIGSGSK
jgi:hypothetical protein